MPATEETKAPTSRITNEPAQLEKVIRTVFMNKNPTVRDREGEGPAGIRSFENGLLTVKHGRPVADTRLLILLHAGHLMLLECLVRARHEDGTESLEPRRLHLRPPRAAQRVAIGEDQSDSVFATDCVPIESIPETLAHMNRKRDRILDVYKAALQEKLPERSRVEFRLRRTQRLDPQMRAIQTAGRPIFAPHTREEMPWAQLEPGRFINFAQYREVSRYEDDKALVSEIAVPLWYRGIFLYGYVHVRGFETLTLPAFEVASALAARAHEELIKNGCLPQSPAKCTVVDISATGVGLLYPQKAGYHKAFMPGADIIFDLQLGSERVPYVGVLKNIRSLEHVHRFGVEFAPMAPEATQKLSEFLARRQEKQKA